MKWKKVTAAVLAAMTMACSLAGCGNSGKQDAAPTESGNQQTSGTQQEQPPQASGDVENRKLTVSVWDNAVSPQFQAIADAFTAQNPGVEIELLDVQADEYNNKLTVMLAGGDSDPDVIMVKDAETQVTMKEKGQILCLDSYINESGIDLSLYDGAAEQLQIDGEQYTLPFRRDWYVLYYNKDLFDAAGVAYPSDDMTWDEFEALAEQMTSGEGNEKVYGSHNHTWMALVSNWAVQDGKNTLMSSDYSFLAPYYEQALRMQDNGVVQSYANLKTGNIHYSSVFEQQQCAMIPMGSWFIATLIKDKADGKIDFNWGVTKIPHPEGVEAGSTVGSVTPIAINAKSDEPDLAWEFVKFATSEAGAEILADNSVFPAISSDAVIDKLASIEGFPEDGKTALEVKSLVFDRPLDAKMAAVRKVIEEEHDMIMIGEEDIENGIANMNERAAEAIAD
ncbi:MAG: sugar ABC transporter substrate-binding protein [Lachnospiraceae bacterium]|nr:sugar ABC transporter substrate-binding protein [Lachnospiraceae bacterium]